jgi:type II secretory pathway pseudopilin PulG
LIELMVVVVIIGVLATITVPLFAERMRARRGQETAQRIAEIYRSARTRALGRGAAVIVSSDGTTFRMLEGVEGTTASTAAGRANCGNLPTRGCTINNWGNLGSGSTIGNARIVAETANGASTTLATSLGASPVTALHVCFSPSGRAFVNTTGTWTPDSWQQLTNVVTLKVTHTDSTRFWDVLVLPNGTARLGL